MPREPCSLTEKPGRPQSTGSLRVRHERSDPAHIGKKFFVCGSSAPMRVECEGGAASCLAGRGPGRAKCSGTQTASATGVMALSESFFKLLVAGNQKPSLASLSLYLCPFRHLESPMPGVLLCCFGSQAYRGAPWLGFNCVDLHISH